MKEDSKRDQSILNSGGVDFLNGPAKKGVRLCRADKGERLFIRQKKH